MASRARQISKVELPNATAISRRASLLARAEGATLRFELDELTRDLETSTQLPQEYAVALARSALASGTALSLVALAVPPRAGHLVEAGAAFGAGVVGAIAVAHFGRLARTNVQRTREHWRRVMRTVRAGLSE